MRADRPSFTAQLVAGVRALYATFPSDLKIAPDPHARALVPPFLAGPVRALSAVPAMASVVHHALGNATAGLTWHVALRTLAIDDAAREAASGGVAQAVLLGAGLDNRAGRLGSFGRPISEGPRVRWFEVDHPDMQRYKRDRLAAAEIEDDRAFVPVNFERDRLDASLEGAGFSRSTPTFWIWESVALYLTRPAIESTLAQVGALSAPGSRLCMTYMRPGSDSGHVLDPVARLLAKTVGEPLRGQLHREDMESMLAAAGFHVLSDASDADLALRYWKDPPSAHPRTIQVFPEWERLAVAERR